MMFRYGKIIESNHKTSRSDRFAEMSKQQQLIENKKQEIKARFEERKRQESVETQPKTGTKTGSEQKINKDHKSLLSSRMQSWKKDDRWRKKSNLPERSESSNNLFSNDGSFLEKYKKMAKKDDDEDVKPQLTFQRGVIDDRMSEMPIDEKPFQFSQNSEEKMLPRPTFDANQNFPDFRDGIPYPPPNINIHPVSSTMAVTSQQPPLYCPQPSAPPSSTIHTSLAAVPASVSLLSTVPSSGASLQTVSLIQVPVSVPASSVILSCPLETTLVSSEPVVHLPVVHSTLSHGSVSVPLQTVPLQTTVIPAQIQITSPAAVPQSSVQTVQINPSSANVILSQTLQSQSILVSSQCLDSQNSSLPNTTIPPPMLPPTNQPPPSAHSVYSPVSQHSQPSLPNTSLPPVHIPPPNYPQVAPVHHNLGLRAVPSFPSANCNSPQFNKESDGFRGERSLLTSDSDGQRQKSLQQSQDNYRDRKSDVQEMEAVARLVANCGDSMEDMLLSKHPADQKLWFLKEKHTPPYIAFRNMVEIFRNDSKAGELSYKDVAIDKNPGRKDNQDTSNVPADDDDSEPEDNEHKRKRKRKRRSRWAPESAKVEIPPVPAILPNPNVGIATPSALGTIVPVVAPLNSKKLPGVSGPVISQVSKNDPALLQYALKAFGTLNLSEEDWKKAEDHYKINLLYQDMLRKREELEKLQAAGKHKYAYDSDEDTEGGTWEHKLRQQEMVATQLWADELTERAKGKHHIGDFLPPDEFERFMEKYDALKQGREPDLSDYKEFKLKEDNIGFQMLQKLGWSEGQGLGSDGSGIVNPVNKAPSYAVSHGLGIEKPDDVSRDDDEYDAYRKRMMLAYRFRPNPLNNPRRPYY